MNSFRIRLLTLLCLTIGVSACGSDDDNTPSGNTSGTDTLVSVFPLKTASIALLDQGESASFAISGDCNGSATVASFKAEDSSFQGISGKSVSTTTALDVSDCDLLDINTTRNDFYNQQYRWLGSIDDEFSEFVASSSLPASIAVGDQGSIGTLYHYSDANKTAITGYSDISYQAEDSNTQLSSVEASADSTLLYSQSIRRYNNSQVLQRSETRRYLLSGDGNMQLQDIRYQQLHNGVTYNLQLNKQNDSAAPQIVARNPTSDATDVATDTAISIRFNEPLDATQINSNTLQLQDSSGNNISGQLNYSNGTLSFTPDTELQPQTEYQLSLAKLQDLAGNRLDNQNWSFTSASIAASITEVSVDTLMYQQSANFSITGNGLHQGLEITSDDCNNIQFTRTSDSNNQTFSCTPGKVGEIRLTLSMNALAEDYISTQQIPKPEVTLTTSMGNIVLQLEPEATPVTVDNFLLYVNAQFYDDLIFHRVIDNFMIQGGGFNSQLQQKSTAAAIALEAAHATNLSNTRGSIAMARTSEPNSATSQFFINVVDNLFLDGSGVQGDEGYAVFGSVIDGMDTVDNIKSVATSSQNGFNDVPVTPVTITSATQTK